VLGEVAPADRPETEGAIGDGAQDASEHRRTVPQLDSKPLDNKTGTPPPFGVLPSSGGETETVQLSPDVRLGAWRPMPDRRCPIAARAQDAGAWRTTQDAVR